jgi:hypothetical protein
MHSRNERKDLQRVERRPARKVPKTRAGKRDVSLPAIVVDALRITAGSNSS